MKYFIISLIALFSVQCNSSNTVLISSTKSISSSITGSDSLVTFIIDSLQLCGLSNATVTYNPSLGRFIDSSHYSDSIDWVPKLFLYSRLSANDHKYYYFYFSTGWSCDPNFSVSDYRITSLDSISNLVSNYSTFGEYISIPGDGYVYVSGYSNEPFYKRKLFTVTNNHLQEVLQPSYYVGINSIALKNIDIYSDKTFNNLSATIQKGDSVSVVLNEGDNVFLVQTKNGIVGWSRLNVNPFDDTSIKDLIYHGD